MHNDNNNEFSLLQIVTTLARANSKVLELRKIITFSNKRASYSNNSFKLLVPAADPTSGKAYLDNDKSVSNTSSDQDASGPARVDIISLKAQDDAEMRPTSTNDSIPESNRSFTDRPESIPPKNDVAKIDVTEPTKAKHAKESTEANLAESKPLVLMSLVEQKDQNDSRSGITNYKAF